MCPHGRAQWRHLVNTIEPSVCGVDAILCQINSTTCYSLANRHKPACVKIAAEQNTHGYNGALFRK